MKTTPKKLLFLLLALSLSVPVLAAPDRPLGTYGQNLRYDLVRGSKNLITFPLEIPMGFQEYHERSGPPVIRQAVGLLDGTVRAAQRLASGVYDFAAAFLPGYQEGFPVDPETLWDLF